MAHVRARGDRLVGEQHVRTTTPPPSSSSNHHHATSSIVMPHHPSITLRAVTIIAMQT
jgi:hypothetical protein